MIVAREQFSPYWLIAVREKALNKNDILKLQLPEAIEKLESQFKVIPFKDASFVLTGMAKVINKKLDYCLLEITELLESCNNPNLKKTDQLNSTRISRKSRKPNTSPNHKLEIEDAALNINESDNNLPNKDAGNTSFMDNNDFNVDAEIPVKNPPPGIEGSLKEIQESIMDTPSGNQSIDKLRAKDSSSNKKPLFTPKLPLDTDNKNSTPQIDITMEKNDELNEVAKDLFGNIDKNLDEEEKEVRASKKNIKAIKDTNISIKSESHITSIEPARNRCTLNHQINKLMESIYKAKPGNNSGYDALNNAYKQAFNLKYSNDGPTVMIDTTNIINNEQNNSIPENYDIIEE